MTDVLLEKVAILMRADDADPKAVIKACLDYARFGHVYPEEFNRCVMCGAEPRKGCTIISGGIDDHYVSTDDPAYATGAPRDWPHSQRSKGDQPEPPAGSVAVKDEPNHYRDEPHTAQCGPDCPLW